MLKFDGIYRVSGSFINRIAASLSTKDTGVYIQTSISVSEEDIEKIITEITKRLTENLNVRQNKTLSLKEAAVFMGIKAQDKSLSSLFSRFSSTRHFKKPLVTYKVGKERRYMEEDLRRFMDENRRRN